MPVTVYKPTRPLQGLSDQLPRGLKILLDMVAPQNPEDAMMGMFPGALAMVKGLTPLVGKLPKKGLLPAVLTKEKGLFVGQGDQSHPEIIQEFLDELSGESKSSLFPSSSGRLKRAISKYWDPTWDKEYGSGFVDPEGSFLTRSEAAKRAIDDKLTYPAIRSILRERGKGAQLHSGHLMDHVETKRLNDEILKKKIEALGSSPEGRKQKLELFLGGSNAKD